MASNPLWNNIQIVHCTSRHHWIIATTVNCIQGESKFLIPCCLTVTRRLCRPCILYFSMLQSIWLSLSKAGRCNRLWIVFNCLCSGTGTRHKPVTQESSWDERKGYINCIVMHTSTPNSYCRWILFFPWNSLFETSIFILYLKTRNECKVVPKVLHTSTNVLISKYYEYICYHHI